MKIGLSVVTETKIRGLKSYFSVQVAGGFEGKRRGQKIPQVKLNLPNVLFIV